MKRTIFAAIMLIAASYCYAGNESKSIAIEPDDDFGYETLPPVTNASSTPVGTIEGNFDVSQTGAAVYTMAIEAPKGLGNMQPAIGISYNSQAGNGIAGWGTNITGLSVITRGMKDLYHDGTVKGMTFLADDAYYLDGKRLIHISGTEGQEGAVYQLEGDPFTVITFHGYYNSVLADTWMDVRTPDGRYYEYGHSCSSKQSYTNKSGNSRIHAWYICHQQDPDENYITYEYQTRNKYIYPTKVSYGKNVNAANSILNTINFSYDTNRMDSVEFVMEDAKGQMDVRLREISTKTDDIIFRTYSFLYNTTGDTSTSKFSRLSQVTVSNGNNESLPATTFEWNYLPIYEQQVSTVNISLDDLNPQIEKQNMQFLNADMNGDGIDDIIRISYVKITEFSFGGYTSESNRTYAYIYRSQIDENGHVSYLPAIKYQLGEQDLCEEWQRNYEGVSVFDYDGDGLNDLLFPYYERINNSSYLFLDFLLGKDVKNGNGQLHQPGYVMTSLSKMQTYTVGDFNGDGKHNVFCIKDSPTNNKYEAIIMTYTEDSSAREFYQFSLNNAPEKVFSGDFNNDGFLDIIIFYNGGYSIYYNNTGNNSIPRFSDSNKKTGTNFGAAWRMEKGDFNGDGLADFLYVGSNSTKYYFALNNGDGTFTTTLALTSSLRDLPFSKDDDKFSLLVRDIDGDGKSDVVIVKAMYIKLFGTVGVSWLLSDGSKLNQVRYVKTPVDEDPKSYNLMLGNFSGNGSLDMMNYGCDLYTNTTASNDRALRLYRTVNLTAGTGKVQKITDGMGNTTTISYAPAANVYTRHNDARLPMVDVPVTFPMVESVISGNGAAADVTTNYTYEGLKAHVQGKGLLGMTKVRTSCPQVQEVVETILSGWNYQYYIPTESTTRTTLGAETAQSKTTFQITGKPNNNYFISPLCVRNTDFDGNVTETTNTYNTENGYITSQKTVYGDNEDMYKAINYRSHIQIGSRWVPTQVSFRQHHYQDTSEYVDNVIYTYDEKGHMLRENRHADSDLPLFIEHTYDLFGNKLSTKTSGYGVSPLTEYYTYDTSGRFVTSKYNSVVTSPICYTRDIWGNVTVETDNTFAPQAPQSVHYEYDGWGRLVRTIRADGTIATRRLGWGSSKSKKYYVLDQGTATPWVVTWYDGKGRKVEVNSASPNNFRGDKETTSYNEKGLPIEIHSSYNGISQTETIAYDTRGRIVSDNYVKGGTTTYSYGNRTVTELRNGQTYTRSYDEAGNLLTSTDPVSSVTYTYNSLWKPKTICSEESVVEMDYDEIGNRTYLTDPDAGTIEYEYDALGRIMSQTDSNDRELVNHYNALGQLIQSSSNGFETNYIYGTSGVENMQLKKVMVNGCSMEYSYDALRRIVHKKQSIDNLDVLEYDYTYGTNGKLSSMTYPNALTENYSYDSYGNQKGMSVNGTTLWEFQPRVQKIKDMTLSELNKGIDFNQPVTPSIPLPDFPLPVLTGKTDRWKLLDEALLLMETYDESGFLKGKKLINGTDTISSLTYSFDVSTGNLLSRTHQQQTETFTYDSMDRLTGTNIGGVPFMTTTFASNGNIASKTGLGSYDYDSNKTHAVVSVENTSALLPMTTQSLTYNDFGKVQSIVDGNYSMSLVYGPDQERWKTELRNGQNIVRTTLYGDGYERITENGTTRHFYYLEGGILCVKQDGQPDQFYYVNTDHQGSVLSIVDANGSSVFEADYDAWGKQTVTLNTIGFHRGYTGHEMLPEFGLINMNGRLYNPDLGRFLSPDNYVQAPDFSQNFNRYTYCLNNPLKYTDPSGEFFGIDDLIVAGISFVAGYVSSGISTGHWGMSSVKSGLITAGMAWLGYNMPGISHSISNALATSMNIGINTTINTFMPFKSFPINSHFSISFAPMFGFGSGGLTAGFGVFAGYNNGDFSVQIGAGAGSLYSAWNAMATIDGWGGGFGKTFYTESVFYGNNISSQSTGTIALAFPNGTFSVSNDLWGDKQDRWRTTSAELAIGSISIGTYVSTNWGAEESEGLHYLDKRDDICGYNPNTNDKGLAWNNGKVFEAPLWLGLRHGNHINRIGYSHRYIQSLTQNFVHKNIVKTPYFLNYNSFNEGIFMYSGYNNPFTLWNR